jgi:LysM repeat protein
MRYIRLIFLFPVLYFSCKTASVPVSSGTATSYERQEYIRKYKNLAISEMKRAGIPASITLAQGLLESDNGNGTLAQRANNHFGIKCHDNWNGRRIYHDDDERKECFRKYNSVADSYRDHSDFLTSSSRYASLFDLKIENYKGWAKGLKKAGYATNRKYANLLIRIIENNNLYVYDQTRKNKTRKKDIAALPEDIKSDSDLVENDKAGEDNFIISISSGRVCQINRIDYIMVKKGDTFAKLADELDMMYWELFKYNELPKDSRLNEGQILYLQPKRNKAEAGSKFHWVEEGETMYDISQKYGIKLAKLYKMNMMEEGTQPKPGQKLWLRGIKNK